MKTAFLDKEWQNIKAIKSLFDSPGWKVYEARIKDLYDYERCQVDALLKQAVKAEQLHTLNDHLSRLRTYHIILNLKNDMVDEFSPTQEGAYNASEEENS